jgi:hypothetical protein
VLYRLLCFAAYDVRSIDELSGRTTGRLGDIRPDTCHAIGGTAKLALRCSTNHAFYAGPKHYSVMTTGRPGLLEQGQRRRIRRGRRTIYGTTGRMEQRTPPPSCRHRRTFRGTTGRSRAADAAVDSAGAAVPLRGTTSRMDPPVDYAGVHHGKRTTRPRDLPERADVSA